MTHDENNHGPMVDSLRRRRSMRDAWQHDGERSLLASVGIIGSLGWMIVGPTLGGLALGRWLDTRLGTGFTLTGGLLIAGAALGYWLAWRRMHQE